MNPVNYLILVLLLAGAHISVALGQSSRVTIMVIDKHKRPVSGMVFLNPGGRKLGKTENGEYKFAHRCEVGQTFKAEPENRAKYYNSEEQVCSKLVVLEVFPRPQLAKYGSADFFHIQEVPTAAGSSSGVVYAGVFGVVSDRVEPVAGGDRNKCKLIIEREVKVASYNTNDIDWKPVTAPLLPTTQPDKVTYYFPTACKDALRQIGDIKSNANEELKRGVMNFYMTNSQEIDMAVVQAAKP